MPEEPVATPQPAEPAPPEPTTPEPQPSEPVKNWYDSFSDDALKADESIKKYKSFDDFGKAFKEKDSMIGKKGVILPNENDPNDMERYYNQLGRPEDHSKYENPTIEVEDEYKQFVSEDKLGKFKEIAHKYGLTQKQYEGLVSDYTNVQLEEVKGIVYEEGKQKEESAKALMNEWVVDYDANSNTSESALKSFSKGISDEKLSSMMADPDIKRLGFNIAQAVSEDTFKRSDGSRAETVQTIQSFIDSQVKDSKSSYYNNIAPDHKAVKEKVRDAYSRLDSLRKGTTL